MNEYTASNGIKIKVISDGQAEIVYPQGSSDSRTLVTWARPAEIAALREFFQAETDELLWRWRDPEQSDFVVYGPFEPDEIGYDLIVIDEQTGERAQYRRSEDDGGGKDFALPWSNKHAWAARHWFAAHPEPKPWESAEPGEHWSLTFDGAEREYVAILTSRRRGSADVVMFTPIASPDSLSLGRLSENITAGHRIYPPGATS